MSDHNPVLDLSETRTNNEGEDQVLERVKK